MTDNRQHPGFPNGRPHISAEHEHLDAMLSEMLSTRGASTPTGLVERAFEASVRHLPQEEVAHTAAPLTLVGTDVDQHQQKQHQQSQAASEGAARRWRLRPMLGNLAMAASLAIVCSIGVWALQNSSRVHQPPVASNDSSEPADETTIAGTGDDVSTTVLAGQLPTESDWQLLGGNGAGSEVAYLFQTVNLSRDELTSDLDSGSFQSWRSDREM